MVFYTCIKDSFNFYYILVVVTLNEPTRDQFFVQNLQSYPDDVLLLVVMTTSQIAIKHNSQMMSLICTEAAKNFR